MFQRFVSLVLDLVVALTLWFGVQEVASTFTGHRPYFSEQIWLVGGFAIGTLWILGLVCSYPLRWRPLSVAIGLGALLWSIGWWLPARDTLPLKTPFMFISFHAILALSWFLRSEVRASKGQAGSEETGLSPSREQQLPE